MSDNIGLFFGHPNDDILFIDQMGVDNEIENIYEMYAKDILSNDNSLFLNNPLSDHFYNAELICNFSENDLDALDANLDSIIKNMNSSEEFDNKYSVAESIIKKYSRNI